MSEAISIENQKVPATQIFVKEGYKKSKLGWIPEEWDTPRIDSIFEFLSTNSFSRSLLNYNEEEGIYNIHYGDIHATFKRPLLDFNIENRIPKVNNGTPLSQNIDFLKDGDLIIADASEDYEGVGEAIELKNIGEKRVISGLHTFAFRDKNKKTAEGFRVYIFRNLLVKKALKTIATGSKVYGISKGNIQKFRVVLPPLPEQQKIAAILSTWDNAIGKQEQLIATKQHYKKGLMQLLLTGKKRFEGFSGEWKEVLLKRAAEINPETDKLPKQFYYIDLESVKRGQLIKQKLINKDDSPSRAQRLLSKGDILYQTVRPYQKNNFFFEFDGDFVASTGYAQIRASENPKFLYHLLHTYEFLLKVLKRCTGTSYPAVNSKDLGKIKIRIPTYEEQQKIAFVLGNVDKEITLLQNQLTQLQTQKRGLMQKLLTGALRVKI